MTVATRKAKQRSRKAEKGEKEIRFYASPKAQEWAAREFPGITIHQAASIVFEAEAEAAEADTSAAAEEFNLHLNSLFAAAGLSTIKEDGK
jgi:hypothetical protein